MKIRNTAFRVALLSLVLVISSCQKEKIEPVRVNATDGLTIKNDTFFELLEGAVIEESTALDTVEIDGHDFIKYSLEISGEQTDAIKPGTIIIDKEGMGKLILVTEVMDNSLKSASGSVLKAGILARGVTATLDMLFNYEGAIVQFTTRENRTRRNADIDGMLNATEIEDQKEKFEMETDGEEGMATTYSKGIIGFDFKGAEFKLKPKDNNKEDEFAAKLTVNKGYISITPSLDFLVEYNPEYIHYSDDAWTNFLHYLNIQEQLVDKTLAVGTMKQLKLISYTDLDYGIDLELEVSHKMANELFEKKIGQWCQVFFAGPVPIGHQTTISFEVDLSATGTLKTNFWYEQKHDIILGLDFKNSFADGELNPEVTYYTDIDTETEKGLTITAEIELEAGVTLKIKEEFYLAGILGPSGKAGVNVKAYADFWSYPAPYGNLFPYQVGVNANVFAEASVDLSLFHIDKATWRFLVSKPWKIAEWNIFQYPSKLEVVNGQGQIGFAGQQLDLPVQVEVQDNWGNSLGGIMPPFPVFFIGDENGAYDGQVSASPVLTSGGIAPVEWTLGAQAGEQEMYACMFDKNMEELGDGVTVNATASEALSPEIISTTPENGASGVDIGTDILIHFSKDIYFTASGEYPDLAGSIAFLADEAGRVYDFDAYIIERNTIVIDPVQVLPPGEKIILVVYPAAIHDNLGTRGSTEPFELKFSTLDDSGLTVEINDILPAEVLDVIEEMDIIINGGNNPPDVQGTYNISPVVLLKSNIETDVIGHQFADIIIQLYDQDPVDLSIKTRDQHAETTGEGFGSFIVGEGNYFTIVGEDLRKNADGVVYCKLAFIISAEKTATGLANCEYTIVMVDDYGDPAGNLIAIGQLRNVYDSDGFSEKVEDLGKGSVKSKGKAIFMD